MLKKLLLIIFIPLFMTGCKDVQKEEITFATWGSATEIKIIKTIITDFEKTNPEIKINLMHVPQNYFQKMHLLFASNTPPDILFINNLNLPLYKNHLEDLTSLANKSEFYPQALEGLSSGGKLLAIPRDISQLIFYVNTDRANLPQKNWRIESILKYKNTSDFVLGCEDTIYWILPYLSYFGGGIYDEKLNYIYNNKENIKALDFYKDLIHKYHIAPDKSEVGSSTLAQMFLEGKISFYLSGRWMYPKISEQANFNWSVINFPYGKSPQYIDVSGWAISKNSKKKDSALKFLNYISSEKSSEYFTSTGLIVPARIKTSQALNSEKHNEKIFLDVIKHSVSTPVSPEYKKRTDKINSELDL